MVESSNLSRPIYFSGIKSLFSMIKAINLQTFVNSLFIPNLLQYRSINDDGVVFGIYCDVTDPSIW